MNSNSSVPSSSTRVVIIGNGIAGISAARQIRKLSDHAITVISSESKYFFARTALMYVFMGHMRQQDIEPYESWFWAKNRIHLIHDHVLSIQFEEKNITTVSGQIIPYDKLIIACGSASNMPSIPGIGSNGVKGLYSLQDLQYIERASKNIKKAVIIGGGLIGIELAEMFKSRNIPVTFLVRESGFWNEVLPDQEAKMISQHILTHGIDLQLNTEVTEIKSEAGNVNAVVTNHGGTIPCDFVGMTVGVHPNTGWLAGTPLETNQGILVDSFLRSNIKDVYAIGDCAELRYPPDERKCIEAIWYTGRIMGETVGYTVCGIETQYVPGFWFNSAKFFDIEYQVYGTIASGQYDRKTFLWKHADERKSMRINYNDQGEVIGFNLLGIRFRQEVCEKWMMEKTSLDDVIDNLEFAFFEPEFSEKTFEIIRQQYYKETGKPFVPKKKKGYNHIYRFLNPEKNIASL